MPHGQLHLRNAATNNTWYDAYDNYGMSLEDGALSELLTPPASKEPITNESRLEHGTRYAVQPPKVAQRDLTLAFHITASSVSDFMNKYNNLCLVLREGDIDMKTSFQSGKVYHFKFVSCAQFSQLALGIAKFSLKLTEPDPTNITDP